MKAILLVLCLSACATPYKHWLSEEEDRALREKCEDRACVLVPADLWETIKKALRAALGVAI